jgi:hypothetical protein
MSLHFLHYTHNAAFLSFYVFIISYFYESKSKKTAADTIKPRRVLHSIAYPNKKITQNRHCEEAKPTKQSSTETGLPRFLAVARNDEN